MYKSSEHNYFIYKYLFLIICVLTWFITLIALIETDLIGGNINLDSDLNKIILFIIGAIALIIFFLLKDKFVNIKMNNQKMIINNNRRSFELKLDDVYKIKKIPILFPPLYKIVINSKKFYLFSTNNDFIGLNEWVEDYSKLGRFIKSKNKYRSPNKLDL